MTTKEVVLRPLLGQRYTHNHIPMVAREMGEFLIKETNTPKFSEAAQDYRKRMAFADSSLVLKLLLS